MNPDRRRQLEDLVRRHARAVGAVCWARSGSVVETDDLVQETMMRACRDFSALREPEKFGAWVRGIAENVCREWGRSRKKQPPALGEEAGGVAAPEPPAPGDDGERIRRALLEIPLRKKNICRDRRSPRPFRRRRERAADEGPGDAPRAAERGGS
jgi:RNA polymerase sigma factor (sigma-70 family)